MPTARRLKKIIDTAPNTADIYAAAYADKFDTLEQLRTAMIKAGIVEHRINAIDALQRAIDDVTIDYLATRRFIDQQVQAQELDPHDVPNHESYTLLEHLRECMVRYSTFAIQYDLARRQQQISEARIAILAHALREVLTNSHIGLSHEQVREIPKMLVRAVENTIHGGQNGSTNSPEGQLDENKATALAEIIRWNTDVEIIDVDEVEEIKTTQEKATEGVKKVEETSNVRKLPSGRRLKRKNGT